VGTGGNRKQRHFSTPHYHLFSKMRAERRGRSPRTSSLR